jgi:hypothetical protein
MWRRVLVVSNKISTVFAIAAVAFIIPVSAIGQQGCTDKLTAEGVVVAVQLDPAGVRSAMDVNSESLGDFAEVWMVRVNRPVNGDGANYVLVEYTHVNRQEPFVTDRELDSTAWKFTLRPVSEDRRETCDWGERYIPTALGKHDSLPNAKTLACFRMKVRPVPVAR